jgi:radical SAM protein with 4Fe4S-binding SPASM domain
MTFKTLELLFWRVNEFLQERPQEELEIIWHGGEPLLLGPRYFAKALDYQRKHCSTTFSRIRHSIQSNLTLLSREFIDPLKNLGVTHLGTSFDPIVEMRGVGKNRDWKEYNQRFLDAICLLKEEGFSWGVIYVATQRSLAKPLEIFNFLTNMSPKRGLMFNPVLVYGSRLEFLKISPQEYGEFLGTIFSEWWPRRDDFGRIEPFYSLTQNLLENEKFLICTDSGACANSHIAVLPDGSASHCGRSADWGVLGYGSIFEKSFSQIFEDPQREFLRRRQAVLPEKACNGCRFWDICHGGCPLDAWFTRESFLDKSEWCSAKKWLIERYVEPIVNQRILRTDCSMQER